MRYNLNIEGLLIAALIAVAVIGGVKALSEQLPVENVAQKTVVGIAIEAASQSCFLDFRRVSALLSRI
jgi:hypothetical protein